MTDFKSRFDDNVGSTSAFQSTRPMNILLSAYACEPCRGSEPAVGWNIATEMARYHNVWVLTRSNNQPAIENELKRKPQPRIRWEYVDPSPALTFWKSGTRGLLPFYYLWQMLAYRHGRELHRRIRFDVIHHVTLTQYWTPSYLGLLDVPFVWGPLGGADSTPGLLLNSLNREGRFIERRRRWVQAVATTDPFLRAVSRRTALALATTQETAARLRRLGCSRVEPFGCVGLSFEELDSLTQIPVHRDAPLRLMSSGRLTGWKGFHLGIHAFARIHETLPRSDYWVFGEGAERRNLVELASKMGLGAKVKFFGDRPRAEVLKALAECDVLIHPSFHDSGAMVCNEAMAAGRPVICLDLGGPATLVTHDTGLKISATNPEEVIDKIADAIRWLAGNPSAREQMGKAARISACEHSWALKAQNLSGWYGEVARPSARTDSVRDSTSFDLPDLTGRAAGSHKQC